MKYFQEVTEWAHKTPNHIYYLKDDKTSMVGCIRSGTEELYKFKNPIRIDVRGRKFTLNKVQFRTDLKEEEPEGRYWIVKGSKGDEYKVSEINGNFSCTCSGFRFRGTCKHSESIRQTV